MNISERGLFGNSVRINAMVRTEVIVTDSEKPAEPAIWDAVWAWESEVRIQPFECTVR